MEMKCDPPLERNSSNKRGNHWSEGLLVAMKNPKLIVFEDDLIVVVKDLYPKATLHFLVCSKENIPSLKSIKLEHLNLLKHMHEVGKHLSEKHKEKKFLLGYHSIPSMVRLHLHVISDDFDSPFLKTKKHWNSFVTEFFLKSEKVIKDLETKGEIIHKSVKESKVLIERPLKCHKCEFKPKNMPDLKHHIKTHLNF